MMLSLRFSPVFCTGRSESIRVAKSLSSVVVCARKGSRPRYPRVWKSKKRFGTVSKSAKLVKCIKGLSNVKEELYGALDSFIAWDLEFPLIIVKKAVKTLENEKEWKRIIQVIKWMLGKGQGKTLGTYYSLINALAEDGRLDEAEELWSSLFSKNLEAMPRIFFNKMISIYHNREMHGKMFEVFADMEELSIRPNPSVLSAVGDAFKKLGMMDKYAKLKKKYPPPKFAYRYIKGRCIKIPLKDPPKIYDDDDEDVDIVKRMIEGDKVANETLDQETERSCSDQPMGTALSS